MGYGVSTANAGLMATAAVSVNAAYAALAIGAPGSAGTANPSSVTVRESLTWGSQSGGVIAITNTPEWTSWAGTNGENVNGLDTWSVVTASSGSFGLSAGLGLAVTMDTGDSLTLSALSLTVPTAA